MSTATAKTFRGRNSTEVLSIIKRELGRDAIILSTRTISRNTGVSAVEIQAVSAHASSEYHAHVPRVTQALASALRNNGVRESLLERLIGQYDSLRNNPEALDHLALRSSISALLTVRSHQKETGKVLAVVGPTGVGKTTSIAKMAIRDASRGCSVGLITIDTHRIGGVEQLGRYAALISAPMKSAATPAELGSALDSFRSLDRVYIDTAGTGPSGQERLAELSSLLRVAPFATRVLLLPASGNEIDVTRTAEAFSATSPNYVGVTKIDETSHFGPCFSCLCDLSLPLSFFGTGQSVPDDFEEASTAMLATLLTRVRH